MKELYVSYIRKVFVKDVYSHLDYSYIMTQVMDNYTCDVSFAGDKMSQMIQPYWQGIERNSLRYCSYLLMRVIHLEIVKLMVVYSSNLRLHCLPPRIEAQDLHELTLSRCGVRDICCTFLGWKKDRISLF